MSTSTSLKKSKSNSIRAKISKYFNALETDSFDYSQFDANSEANSNQIIDRSNWNKLLISCGSNAFGQLTMDSFDLMAPSFKVVKGIPNLIPQSVFRENSSPVDEITHLGCGANYTMIILKNDINEMKYFLWGSPLLNSGSLGNPMRIPQILPIKSEVRQLSCGQTHIGIVTSDGQVYTWGNGDNGMLGHGNKNSVQSPKKIDFFEKLIVSQISCGAYHTAVIACTKDEISYIHIPEEDSYFSSGKLYSFGQGKAGQLGIDRISTSGSSAGIALHPTMVNYFPTNGWSVCQVSCGFHHTLVIAVPMHSTRVFTSFVFAFGWGEHGRLGLGSEEKSMLPHIVNFPKPFHALEVCAGEQHSLACGKNGCYGWGSNSMGQLGISSPQYVESSNVPVLIPLPEGMRVTKLGAGGRHSAGITSTNKLLTWGWNEDGQLGAGTEKSSYLPRPIGVPRIHQKLGTPLNIALGMSHTVVLLANADYTKPASPLVEKKKEVIIQYPKMEAMYSERFVIRRKQEVVEAPPPPVFHPKSAKLCEEEGEQEEEMPQEIKLPAVRSIRDILQRRDDHSAFAPKDKTPPPAIEEAVIEAKPQKVEILLEAKEVLRHIIEVIEEDDRTARETANYLTSDQEGTFVRAGESSDSLDMNNDNNSSNKSSQLTKGFHVYYKPGQNLDNCLIANYAKREEKRKAKKLQQSLSNDPEK